jgi:formylglycine-generating enzyme required for sulfatase activity
VVSGEGASVAGEGAQRTVTVTKPDGKKKITLLATKTGYRSDERVLQPAVGESTPLTFHLQAAATVNAGPTLVNSLDMKFVLIPAGEFLMGSPESIWETPHRVEITEPFFLGVYEVTESEFEKVMGTNPSSDKGAGPTTPVENVSWSDALEFCTRLSLLPAEQATGRQYRLPSEAQWEYACRAGSTSRYCLDESTEYLGAYAWCRENSQLKKHPVGEKKPNAWGLYDMHGNVEEWCEDWHELGYYDRFKSGVALDPRGPTPTGPTTFWERVLRGGCWISDADSCRSAYRCSMKPSYRSNLIGFRVGMVPTSK